MFSGGVNNDGSNYTAYILKDEAVGWKKSTQELPDYCQPTMYSTFTPILFWDMDISLSDSESDTDSDSLISYGHGRMSTRPIRRHGRYGANNNPMPVVPMDDSQGSLDSDSSLEAVGMHPRHHQYMENDSDSWSSDEW